MAQSPTTSNFTKVDATEGYFVNGTEVIGSTGTDISGTFGTSTTTVTSGAGAVAITGTIHEVTTEGTGDALTLADGAEGQELFIVYVAEDSGTDTAILTPDSFGGGSTITFNNVGDTATIKFTNSNWYVKGLGGAAAVA